MTIKEYQRKAMRTATPKCYNTANAALGLTGEAGEVADEVKKCMYQGHPWQPSKIIEELGDVLFAAVRVASTLDKDPEQALHSACEKFIKRFTAMEQSILASGRTLEELSREELLASWDAQKRNGR